MRELARGWQLARRTLTVLRNEPSLAIFRVVLYRFATDGVALAGFDAAELAGAVRPTSRRRRHPV
jgi:hypothetical protein